MKEGKQRERERINFCLVSFDKISFILKYNIFLKVKQTMKIRRLLFKEKIYLQLSVKKINLVQINLQATCHTLDLEKYDFI